MSTGTVGIDFGGNFMDENGFMNFSAVSAIQDQLRGIQNASKYWNPGETWIYILPLEGISAHTMEISRAGFMANPAGAVIGMNLCHTVGKKVSDKLKRNVFPTKSHYEFVDGALRPREFDKLHNLAKVASSARRHALARELSIAQQTLEPDEYKLKEKAIKDAYSDFTKKPMSISGVAPAAFTECIMVKIDENNKPELNPDGTLKYVYASMPLKQKRQRDLSEMVSKSKLQHGEGNFYRDMVSTFDAETSRFVELPVIEYKMMYNTAPAGDKNPKATAGQGVQPTSAGAASVIAQHGQEIMKIFQQKKLDFASICSKIKAFDTYDSGDVIAAVSEVIAEEYATLIYKYDVMKRDQGFRGEPNKELIPDLLYSYDIVKEIMTKEALAAIASTMSDEEKAKMVEINPTFSFGPTIGQQAPVQQAPVQQAPVQSAPVQQAAEVVQQQTGIPVDGDGVPLPGNFNYGIEV